MKRLYALRADELTDAVNAGVLEVRIFSGPVDGIIVTTKQAAGTTHLGTLLASCTLAHGFSIAIIAERRYFSKWLLLKLK